MTSDVLVSDPVLAQPAKVPQRPHRVLFVDHTATMGGGEIALLNLASALDRTRYVPVVILLQDGPLRGKLDAAGVETHLLSGDPGVLHARKDSLGLSSLLRLREAARTMGMIAKLRRQIRRLDVDLVHTNSLKSDIIGGIAARLARKPVVWHIRDRIEADYLPISVVWAFRVLINLIPTWVIANSAATLKTVARAGQRKLAVPSGINLKMNAEDESEPSRSAEKRVLARIVHDGTQEPGLALALEKPIAPVAEAARDDLSGDGPRVGLVGRIARWKGQHVFLCAAAWVLKQYPATRFQIIGAPLFDERDYEQEVRALAAKLGIESAVEFMGFRPDVSRLVSELDILVHASITGEPFGQVIIEGMAAGKPVVATDGGGVPEIVVNEETGLLVPMNDAAAMAEAICRLLGDPERARQMGQRGRSRVSERFTIAHTATKVQAVYDELIHGARSTR